ncbi:hypothetical protein [Aminobacter aminovorans]|uniref:hypothetical protein n=1 Tax=Aminobacter aminovorans TaxID=83263 RepID=UPI0028564CF7|nr:hypothetical protein [Aminobacter aminovorans]MDR7220277.1 opacity protein-like surface antigen [Aminobacter aminovorans]
MKRVLAGIVLALSSTSVFAADTVQPIVEEPVAAGPRVSGHVEAYLGGLWIDTEGGNENGWVAGGAARLNYPIDARWNIQGDVFADGVWFDEGDINSYGAALHGYWRDPSSFALGAFATINGYGGDSGPEDIYSFTVGPEGQVYFDNLTLYAQAYYGQLRQSGFSEHLDIWGVRGVARYFAQPNLRFDAELGYRSVDISDGADTVSAALQGNYRFDGTPWTVFGRYQFDHLSGVSSESVNIHKLVLGIRATFGADTLLDEDRNGATMDTARSTYLFF